MLFTMATKVLKPITCWVKKFGLLLTFNSKLVVSKCFGHQEQPSQIAHNQPENQQRKLFYCLNKLPRFFYLLFLTNFILLKSIPR